MSALSPSGRVSALVRMVFAFCPYAILPDLISGGPSAADAQPAVVRSTVRCMLLLAVHIVSEPNRGDLRIECLKPFDE
jgi:hypothetical protein